MYHSPCLCSRGPSHWFPEAEPWSSADPSSLGPGCSDRLLGVVAAAQPPACHIESHHVGSQSSPLCSLLCIHCLYGARPLCTSFTPGGPAHSLCPSGSAEWVTPLWSTTGGQSAQLGASGWESSAEAEANISQASGWRIRFWMAIRSIYFPKRQLLPSFLHVLGDSSLECRCLQVVYFFAHNCAGPHESWKKLWYGEMNASEYNFSVNTPVTYSKAFYPFLFSLSCFSHAVPPHHLLFLTWIMEGDLYIKKKDFGHDVGARVLIAFQIIFFFKSIFLPW